MVSRTLLLSIKPEHAAKIFSGDKKVELRRIRPQLNKGDTVLIYVTAPEMALAGGFEVSQIYEAGVSKLWRDVGHISGVTQLAFRSYFAGCEVAFAIGVRRAWRMENTVRLETLRRRIPGFNPPQSYWYLPAKLCESILHK